jgi:hydroxyacylglutathione hydrolase
VNKGVKLLVSLMRMSDKRLVTHSFPPYEARAMDILVDGDTNLGQIGIGLRGRIAETPGHGQDCISIVLDDGDCLVGDAAANFPAFLGTRYCAPFVEDLAVYYASWQKLISAGARQIFPAHGEPFPVERLGQNIYKNSQEHMVMIS